MRVSRDGGRSYPRSRERALTGTLPDQPAAVRVFDDDGEARCLVADLDVARAGQAQVDQDAARLLGLLGRCGGRAFTDRSPTGGRHVYLPLAVPVTYDQVRAVAYALAVLLPSLDIAPVVNLRSGCIRPPGARHKTGGWQQLDGPLADAQAVVADPNPPAVWAALLDALRPQLTALQPASTDPALAMPAQAAGAAGSRERQACTAPAASPGGPRPLRPAVLATARTGSWDPTRYASPSEARQGVLAAAAASGWTLPDVLGQVQAGRWPGLWGFYARYRNGSRREALAGDWLSALRYARHDAPASRPSGDAARPSRTTTRHPSAMIVSLTHNLDTREPITHRGAPARLPAVTPVAAPPAAALHGLDERGLPREDYAWLRAWWSAVRRAERDRYVGRAGLSVRLVLRALGNAGQKTGRRHLAFGVRSLAIAAGLSRTTVAVVLRQLRDERDPLLLHLVDGRGLHGDLYELRIPDGHLEQARTDAWRPGRIEALLPCFRVLGVPAALVYENLDQHPHSSWELAHTSLLSVRAVQQALVELAAHGLADRDPTGWSRGAADPAQVARAVGADQLVADQVQRYTVERRRWQTRLGAHGPTIQELLHASPTPPEPDLPPAQRWLPRQPHPPPNVPDTTQTALDLVRTVLGGTVLAAG